MLSDERREEIRMELAGHIEGGVSKGFMQIVNGWVENYEDNEPWFKMSQEEFRENETEICGIFDDGWFECQGCGWTVTREQESYSQPEYCTDCEPDEDE